MIRAVMRITAAAAATAATASTAIVAPSPCCRRRRHVVTAAAIVLPKNISVTKICIHLPCILTIFFSLMCHHLSCRVVVPVVSSSRIQIYFKINKINGEKESSHNIYN